MVEIKEKIFCKRCQQRLFPKGFLRKGDPIFEFQDGYYCEKCGKIKVEEARKGNK